MEMLDLVAAAAVAISMLFGGLRGFCSEASTLIVWGGASAAGSGVLADGRLPEAIAGRIGPGALASGAAWTIGFVIAFIVLALLASAARNLIPGTGGGLDRSLGAALGFVRGIAAAVAIMVVVAVGARPPYPRWVAGAAVCPALSGAAAHAIAISGRPAPAIDGLCGAPPAPEADPKSKATEADARSEAKTKR